MEQRAFNSAFDMPITKAEALAVLEAWGEPTSMTFDRARAARCHKLLSGEVPEFTREERYVVIKLNKLSPVQTLRLKNFMADNNIATRTAVVVEKGWPEYEKVWDMLAKRVMQGE